MLALKFVIITCSNAIGKLVPRFRTCNTHSTVKVFSTVAILLATLFKGSLILPCYEAAIPLVF